MPITRIQATNFKSFDTLDVRLSDFNVVIGPNAAGKSNLIGVLSFIKAIPEIGLRDSLLAHGAPDCITRLGSGSQTFDISISTHRNSVVTQNPFASGSTGRESHEPADLDSTYSLSLQAAGEEGGYKVRSEQLSIAIHESSKPRARTRGVTRKKARTIARIVLAQRQGKVSMTVRGTNRLPEGLVPWGQLSRWISHVPFSPNSLMLENQFFQPFFLTALYEILGAEFIDLDPTRAKYLSSAIGKPVLMRDGSNLALVLRHILSNAKDRERFLRHVRDLLPFVNEVASDRVANSLLIRIEEAYCKGKQVPAMSISDGTIAAIAMIVALYFQHRPLLILEEPERNVHPGLISKMVHAMKDVSVGTQILLTTHNPEFVESGGLESLILLSRDEHGKSVISRPSSSDQVRSFLRQDMGLGRIFSRDLMSP